ncbi:M20 aminoacylase family protein [Elioraea rosea]|uniref:M20 aminoacylase family protein n=1 Tax=Elioraea rosea TaxID=2492390 RepID=UPI0011839F34|nr:M20 aminoacylase family protein [Elioraea rosea]
MPIHNRIAAFADDMTAWRRDLHAHPELGLEEHRTAAIVAEKLAAWGIKVHAGLATTGVVGTLKVGNSNRAIAIRADMDALPMEEANDFPHRSQFAGKMHACGHDGHTTMLLGAARYLAETKNFDGTVHFVFQPAEEGAGGGRIMVEEGLFDLFPADAVYGAHNDTNLPIGEMYVVAGPNSAASDRFIIHVDGRGGHAARPHVTIDPITIGAQIVMAYQTLVSRRLDPADAAVLSITQFHAGSAGNVIPETAFINGTVRTMKPETQDMLEAQMGAIARAIAESQGATVRFEYSRGYPIVMNNPDATERAAAAAAKVIDPSRVHREKPLTLGGEDFAYMAQKVPGCFVRFGQRGPDGKGGTPVHNSKYDFNDAILPLGASYWATLVEQELARE